MYSRLTSISIDESMIPIFWISAPALYFHIGRRSPPYIFRLFILRCTILLATARAPRARTRSQSTIHTAPLSLVASPKGDYTNTNANTNTKTNTKTETNAKTTTHKVQLTRSSSPSWLPLPSIDTDKYKDKIVGKKTTNSDLKVRRRLCLVPPSPCPSPTFDTAVGNEQHHGK